MGFLYVIAWKSELETGGKVDSWIEELLSGLHKYNIRVFVEKNKEKGKDIVKQALKEHGLKPEDGLLLAASDNLLQQAEETGLATIGFLNPEWKNQTYRKAQILVEGFEEVDFYFLERIYKRKHHIPWRVIDTKRCYLREMTMDDLDDLYEIGCIGLIKCINNFDVSYEVRFSTYAVPMIMGEIKRFLRDDGMVKVSRSLKEIAYKVKMESVVKTLTRPSLSLYSPTLNTSA